MPQHQPIIGRYQAPGFYEGRPLANILQRGLSYFIDGLLVWLPFFIGVRLSNQTGVLDAPAELLSWVVVLLGLAVFVGNYIYLQGVSGQSLGKRLLKLRLARMSDLDAPPGVGVTFGRFLGHLVLDTIPCYIGWAWPLWDRYRQTFADKMVSTVVLDES